MATYRPDQLGIKPPAGGFQQGGWYNGRQYWNGSLSEPGVIHPESDQQGAGREVDKEVIDQSGPNNYDYIEREREKARKLHDSIDQGTGLPVVNKPYKPPVSNKPGAGSGSGATLPTFTTPTIDLNSIYSKLYESSGISNIERSLADLDKKLAGMKSGYDAAMSNINDNPFLSEASRVGRASKLSTDFQNSIAGVEQEYARRKDDIIRQKADIEAKMNIELKQFDINSQQAQQALQQFNTLLSMGALSGASGEDIANITRQTGISSDMIYSAINKQAQDNIKTSTISYDDGTSQGFAVINTQTGEIINKQAIAQSKPGAAKEASESEKKQYYAGLVAKAAEGGMTLSQIFNSFSQYTQYIDPTTIYEIYNSTSKYGPDKGKVEDLQKYGVKAPTTSVPTYY